MNERPDVPASPLSSAADQCRRSGTPCVLLRVPEMEVVATSEPFAKQFGQELFLTHRPDWDDIKGRIARVAGSGVPSEMELSAKEVSGSVRLHMGPVAGQGRNPGVLVWLDGPRLAEEEVRAAAEQAVAAKSRFLAAASHDLRQPFQAMRFFHSVLASHAKEPQARRAAEMLGKALASGEQLLNGLLDISILDAGTVKARHQAFDLGGLTSQVVAEFAPMARAKGLRFLCRPRSARVESDPVLVERMLRNLVSNAIHYTRQGGVLVGIRYRGGGVRLEVWDTGFGIPEDQMETIFEEFHQLENPERDRSRGLGLGLAIVRRLAQLLELRLDVSSRLGRGSVFALELPLAGPEERPTASVKSGPTDLSLRTILVVDDDAMVLLGLQMILEGWGVTVLAAEDMGQVLEKLDEGRPDLILSDLRLRAGVSGFQVVDRVRAVLGDPLLPAVILTGETGKAELAEGRRRDFLFLHKPVQSEPLRQALSQALTR